MKRLKTCIVLWLLAIAMTCFGDSQRKQISYDNFGGGLYSLPNYLKCPKNMFLEFFNLMLNQDGSLKEKWGQAVTGEFTSWGTFVAPSVVVDIVSFPNSPGAGFAMYDSWKGCISCAQVYKYNYGASQTMINNGQFAYLDGQMCRSSNATNVIVFTDTAVGSATMVPGSPVSRVLLAHNSRLFAASGAILLETSVASATDWSGGESWEIGGSEAGYIVALGSLENELYIFFEGSIFRMTGFSPSERVVTRFVNNIGTRYPDTVKNADLAGLGPCIVFVSSARQLMVLTSGGVVEIGDTIKSRLSSLSPTYSPNTWGNLFVVFDASRHLLYLFDQNRSGSNFSSDVDNEIIMFTDMPYSYNGMTRWPFASIGYKPDLASRAFNITAGCQNLGGSAYYLPGEAILAANPAASGSFPIATTTFLYYSSGVTPLSGTTAGSRLRTREEDAGDSRIYKGWKTLAFVGTLSNASFTQFDLNLSSAKSLGASSGANVPMYNWTKYLSIRADDLTTLYEMTIDFVVGPKLE